VIYLGSSHPMVCCHVSKMPLDNISPPICYVILVPIIKRSRLLRCRKWKTTTGWDVTSGNRGDCLGQVAKLVEAKKTTYLKHGVGQTWLQKPTTEQFLSSHWNLFMFSSDWELQRKAAKETEKLCMRLSQTELVLIHLHTLCIEF